MANVYTSLSNAIWYTDKCSISTGSTAVTYQVYATALGDAPAAGNIYSGPPEIGANEIKQIYVGVGNYITVSGSNYTAQEIGGQTSAQAGTGPFTENLTPPPVTGGSMYIPDTSSRIDLSPGIIVGGTTTTPFTAEGWVYSTVNPGTDSGPVLLSTTISSGTPAYAKALTINVSSSTQVVVDSNGAAATAFDFAETMLVNTWYYLAVTRDASGYIQVWLGKDGDAIATASTTGRFDSAGAGAAWTLTGLSDCIGAFVPANRFTTGYISNLRVDSSSRYITTDATIPVPTAPFAVIPVTPQVGSSLDIATNDGGGLTGWGSTALAVASNPTIISTYAIGSTITWQDGTTATITGIDNYAPLYIDIFWDTPKTGTLFPITLKTSDYAPGGGTVFLQNDATLTDQTSNQTLSAVGTAAGNALNPF